MNLFSNKNNVITYTVNKVGSNNLCVSVQNGEVVINAPWYVTNMQIQKVVEEKKNWILNKIAEYEEANKKAYKKIQTVKVLGKNFDLVVSYKNVKNPSLSIEKDEIKVVLPHEFKKLRNAEIITTIMDKMYDKIHYYYHTIYY